MSKISCDIIRDLIPSYADNICSKDSADLVREHLRECSACSDYLHMISDTQLVAGKTDQAASRYLQKVRSHYRMVCVVAVVVVALLVLLTHIEGAAASGFNGWGFYVLTPVLLIVGSLCQSRNRDSGRAPAVLVVLSLAMTAYSYVLWFLLMYVLESGTPLFLIAPSKAGPVVEIQMSVMVLAQLAIFAWVSMKKGAAQRMNRVLLATSAVGIGVLMGLINILWKLESVAEVRGILAEITVVYAIEAMIFAGIRIWRRKRMAQKDC